MKILILTTVIIMSTNIALASGSTVGNGGNVIACTDTSGRITSVQLLDYYELQQMGGVLQSNPGLQNYPDILKDIFNRWEKVAPKRMAQYRQWLTEFSNESGVYSGIQIPPTEDTGLISIPKGCTIQPAAFQRPESELMPGVKRYLINKDLWDQMPIIQKAGLVLHELIYREAIAIHHKTSFSTRYFTGYLSSSTPDPINYAAVVSKLPFSWVEYGTGAILKIGELDENGAFIQITDINNNGSVSGVGNMEILGSVETKDIKFEFNRELSKKLSATINYSSSDALYSTFNFDSKTQLKKLFVSLDNFNIEIVSPMNADRINCKVGFYNEKRILLTLEKLRLVSTHPSFLNLDPEKSFYLQPDGSKISSISRIFKDDDKGSDKYIATYGAKLITASGDTWVHRVGHDGYVKQ